MPQISQQEIQATSRSPQWQQLTEELRKKIAGKLISPDDADYDNARQVYNGMIQKFPLLIVQCTTESDVAHTVRFARSQNLPLAVRGGGHNGPGFGTCDEGVVLDLSPMRNVRVDAAARTVQVDGGCVWADVDKATHEYGLATVSGIVSTTGVGGLTLGGGHGYLTRKYGLTIDNLLAATVILADGSTVIASEHENSDLFWALRGGGGNFGVVTSFQFRVHPVDKVVAGPMLWTLEKAPEVMRWYREFLPSAPEDLNGFFAFLVVPPAAPFPEALHGKKMCGVVWCYTGEQAHADSVFDSIRARVPPEFAYIGPMPYPMLQSMFDPLYAKGEQWYWKGDFFKELSDDAITAFVKNAENLPSAKSTLHLYPVDGAVHRMNANATAFRYRDAGWSEVILGVDPNLNMKEQIIAWARDSWQDLHRYSLGGAYVNFMMDEGNQRVRATYGDNFDRLVAIKKKYDPTNFFHINQNIPPEIAAQEVH